MLSSEIHTDDTYELLEVITKGKKQTLGANVGSHRNTKMLVIITKFL